MFCFYRLPFKLLVTLLLILAFSHCCCTLLLAIVLLVLAVIYCSALVAFILNLLSDFNFNSSVQLQQLEHSYCILIHLLPARDLLRVPPPVVLLSRWRQKRCTRAPDSVCTHLPDAPALWVAPTAVVSETDWGGWGSLLLQSHFLSNPSAGRTWAPAGPAGMTSSTRHHEPSELDETLLDFSVWRRMRGRRLERVKQRG